MEKIRIILTIAAAFGLTVLVSAQQWLPKASLPVGGEPHISFSLDGFGYWGGIDGGTMLWKYNPATNAWFQQQDLPLPSSGMPAFTVNGKAYYMPISNGQIYVYEYQSSLDSWVPVSVFPGEARGGSFVFTIGSMVYMTMGINGGGYHLSDVWEFNANEYLFAQKGNFPFENRWGGSAFSINGKGYIGMGNLDWNFQDPNGKDLYEYSPISDTWSQKANLPVAQGRYATAGFSVENFGYVLCGEGTNPFNSYDEFWRYDPVTDSWLEMPGYGGGGANYLRAFVIGGSCYAGKGMLWSFNASNCTYNTEVAPAINSISSGFTATFSASTSEPGASYVWQSDFGQGFQSLGNYGNYSGAESPTLSIANVQLSNHNQPIRVITTSGACIDTSSVAVISIADTCVITVTDTTFITVTDTLVIDVTIAALSPPNNFSILRVFPNPANDHITIDYGDYILMMGHELNITNSLGQSVFQTEITQQFDYVSLDAWGGSGLYFINVIDPQGATVALRKIVLQ